MANFRARRIKFFAFKAFKHIMSRQSRNSAIVARFHERRLKSLLFAIKHVCKEELLSRVVKRNKELEKQVNERALASQNSSALYIQRINSLESQVIEKDQEINRINLVKEELRLSIVAKEQSQIQLNTRLEKSASDLQCMQSEVSARQSILAKKFSAIEADYKVAQDALQE